MKLRICLPSPECAVTVTLRDVTVVKNSWHNVKLAFLRDRQLLLFPSKKKWLQRVVDLNLIYLKANLTLCHEFFAKVTCDYIAMTPYKKV